MLKLIKWIWAKSEEQALKNVLNRIHSEAMYHQQQSELAYYKNKYEPRDKDYDDIMYKWNDNHSPEEHEAAAKVLWKLLEDLNPKDLDDGREEET